MPPRNLPPPATVNDFYAAAMVEVLDEAVRLLGEIRDRMPESASVDTAGGPGASTMEGQDVDQPADEVADQQPADGAALVTEPAPVKTAKPAAKKAALKSVKES